MGGGDRLERVAASRMVGNAYRPSATPRPSALRHAVEAMDKSKALSRTLGDDLETGKLNFSYGHVLFGLSEGTNVAVIQEARRRYAIALEKARIAMPEGVPDAQEALSNAEQLLAVAAALGSVSHSISQVQDQIRQTPTPPPKEDRFVREMFGILEQDFQARKNQGTFQPDREAGLGDIMDVLKGMVDGTVEGRTLEEATRDRGKLSEMMGSMQTMLKNPTLPGPKTLQGRAAVIMPHLQELKAFAGVEGMRTGKSQGETDKAMDLYYRIARLTTAVNQTQADEQALLRIEREQVPPLRTRRAGTPAGIMPPLRALSGRVALCRLTRTGSSSPGMSRSARPSRPRREHAASQSPGQFQQGPTSPKRAGGSCKVRAWPSSTSARTIHRSSTTWESR